MIAAIARSIGPGKTGRDICFDPLARLSQLRLLFPDVDFLPLLLQVHASIVTCHTLVWKPILFAVFFSVRLQISRRQWHRSV